MPLFRALKSAVVAAAAWVLYVTGILHVLLAIRLRNRAVVLMYHRVLAPDEVAATYSHPGIIVAADTFDRHLNVLRRWFRVLTVDEFAQRLQRGEPFPSRSCLITFDDGWSDTHAKAFPLLRKHGLPAIVFLPVDYIGSGKRFWQESVTRALARAAENSKNPTCRRLLERVGIHPPFPAAGNAGKFALRETVGQFKDAPLESRIALVDLAGQVLAESGDRVPDVDTFLSWDQVREMSAQGVDFGSHAASHELLDRLPIDRVRDEAGSSRRTIEAVLGRPVIAFSYPNGNHDADVCRAVAAEGYRLAFTTEMGTVGRGDDPVRLRRVNVHEGSASSVPLFMARIAGVL